MTGCDTALLFKVLYASQCRGTHHKLAMQALRMLRVDNASNWFRLFLEHSAVFIKGSKAPDDEFKDFKNHVLHVRENYWGGAVSAACRWYAATVKSIRSEDWPTAVFNAGVLSHYVTDPLMPLHTGQTETENTIHRAVEWSVNKAFDSLWSDVEKSGGVPATDAGRDTNWLADLVVANAEFSNGDYQTILDHYQLDRGVRDPVSGLDGVLRGRFSLLLGKAASSFACVLERAIREAATIPQPQDRALSEMLRETDEPIERICNRLDDHRERAIVDAAYRELQQTGRVVQKLPEDLRTIRRLHAQEVLGVTEADLLKTPVEPTGTKFDAVIETPRESSRQTRIDRPTGLVGPHSTRGAKRTGESSPPLIRPSTPPTTPQSNMPRLMSADPSETAPASRPTNPAPHPAAKESVKLRFYLDRSQPIVDAPSIGPRTAEKLSEVGVHTVQDLLGENADELATRLRRIAGASRYANRETIADWQAQARLVCCIPNLRGHDAQILVACGIVDADALVSVDRAKLCRKVTAFVSTPEGQRVLRDGAPPDDAEVIDWITWSRHARPLHAA